MFSSRSVPVLASTGVDPSEVALMSFRTGAFVVEVIVVPAVVGVTTNGSP